MSLTILSGVADVASRYDVFICDLWGVVHDGERLYPGVADCLQRLRARDARIAFLSNAPRPAPVVARDLVKIGVTDGMADVLVTSGDATHEALSRRDDAWHAALGRRFFHLGPPRCQPTIEDIGEEVGLDAAEFIVCTGLFDDESEQPEDYRDLLAPAAARGLPLICANPDRIVMRGERMLPCAGAVADLYAELGGPVRHHGKPYPSVYERVFERLQVADRSRAVMIGDSFHTDIEGARNVGLDSIWIAGGVHADEVGYRPDAPLDADRIAAALAAAGERPTAVMAQLSW